MVLRFGRMEEQGENFKKRKHKKHQRVDTELKNTINELKNRLEWFNRRLDVAQ